MWGVHAAAPLNIVHFGFGVGAIFANLLVRPFITEKTLLSSAINNERISANIFIPYSITAFLCFLLAVGHLIFYVTELKKRRENVFVRQVMNKSKRKKESS
jgi:fucose permease